MEDGNGFKTINSEFDLVQKFYENDLKVFILPSKHAYKCFDGQKENEKAMLYIRKHWIVQLGIILGATLELIIPFIILFVLAFFFPHWLDNIFFRVLIVFVHMLELFIVLYWYVKWIDNHLDLIIVTNMRIVDINQTRIFNRKISSTSLKQIQDVSGAVKGVIPSLLNYGTINIETAGSGQLRGVIESMMKNQGKNTFSSDNISEGGNVFEMPYVYNPIRVATAILNIRDYYLRQDKLAGNVLEAMGQTNPQQPMNSASPGA
jgi:hypothetical protein